MYSIFTFSQNKLETKNERGSISVCVCVCVRFLGDTERSLMYGNVSNNNTGLCHGSHSTHTALNVKQGSRVKHQISWKRTRGGSNDIESTIE